MTYIHVITATVLVSSIVGAEPVPISRVVEKIEGNWKTTKISVTDKNAFAALSSEDQLTLAFDAKGGCLWTFFSRKTKKEQPLEAKYMIGSDHIGFLGPGFDGAFQVWSFSFSDDKLIMKTVPASVTLTFERTKEADQPATAPKSKPEGQNKPQLEKEAAPR